MKNLNYLCLLLITFCTLNTLNAQHILSGNIACLVSLDGLANQEVKLSGTTIPDMVTNTDANGNYSFTDLPAGGNYAITIFKDDDPLNGVSTFDMVKIFNYILNIEPWPSPFHILAADVNGSGSVTTIDLVLIRKVILFIDPTFPNTPSWNFATTDYDPATSSGTVGGATIDDLQADEVIDFIAVKIGDVNGSAACEQDGTW